MSHLAAHGAPAAVLALVGRVLHRGGDQAVAAEQVALQPLVCKEPELTLLTVEGRPVIDHLGVNLDLLEGYYVKMTELIVSHIVLDYRVIVI